MLSWHAAYNIYVNSVSAEINQNMTAGSVEEGEDENSEDSNLQLELSVFRAQWMSELRPGSGIKTRLSKSAELRKTQDLVREEKVGGSDVL
ncbi:F-box only protein 9 [Tachysurus ichikawai]